MTFNNTHFPLIPENGNSLNKICIPARSEVIVQYSNASDGTSGLCESAMIQENIFLGNCLTKTNGNRCLASVINICEDNIMIEIPQIELSSFNNEQILKHKDFAGNRFSIIINSLNFEEDKRLRDILRNYEDVFFLEEESITFTEAAQNEIYIEQSQPPVNTKPYRLPFS